MTLTLLHGENAGCGHLPLPPNKLSPLHCRSLFSSLISATGGARIRHLGLQEPASSIGSQFLLASPPQHSPDHLISSPLPHAWYRLFAGGLDAPSPPTLCLKPPTLPLLTEEASKWLSLASEGPQGMASPTFPTVPPAIPPCAHRAPALWSYGFQNADLCA